MAFSYSNVTHKIFYLAKIDARDKEKTKLRRGEKNASVFFIRDNLLRDVIFLCFFFVHNIFFFLHKNNFFHILPPILSDFMSHVPQKTKNIAGKKVGFLAIKYQIGLRKEMYFIFERHATRGLL